MENNNANYNAEIDLDQVKQKVQGYIGSINDRFFDLILFIKRNIVIILLLFITGAGLGTYLDSGSKSFTHKIFVIPNFNSVNYLYEQVDLIESKLKKGDKEFLAGIGIKEPNSVSNIEIEPIVDIYDYINDASSSAENNKSRLELFKIITDNGDVEKEVKEGVTSKNYKYHLITITTNKEEDRSELIDPLLKYFNSNPYFLQVQKQNIKDLEYKINQYDSIIVQVDRVVAGYSKESRKANPSLLYYNDNTDLADLLNIKNGLVTEQNKNHIRQIDFQSIVKDRAVVSNIAKPIGLLGKMKVILPLLFLFIFVIVVTFRNYYKRQMVKRGLK